MTNLNKILRQQIIDSVVSQTYFPDQKKAIIASASAAARQVVLAQLPEGFAEATKSLPKEWFHTVIQVEVHHEAMPELIMQLDRKRSYGYIRFEPFPAPANFSPAVPSLRNKDKPGAPCWETILAAQIDAATKLKAKEDALRAELNAFLASVRTYAQVIEKMPDLERHLPTPPARVYPVVTSTKPLANLLSKSGFDRSAA